VTCKRCFVRLLSIHVTLAGKCVGRVEAYIITALHYIAQKNAADAFITHGYIAFAPRLYASEIISWNVAIVIDVAVSGCVTTNAVADGSLLQQLRRLLFLLILDVIWMRASSMLVYGGICCTRYVCMLYSTVMMLLCGTRHRYPHCCETVMQTELESRRS
jgi:hypothetical protein